MLEILDKYRGLIRLTSFLLATVLLFIVLTNFEEFKKSQQAEGMTADDLATCRAWLPVIKNCSPGLYPRIQCQVFSGGSVFVNGSWNIT